MSVNPEIACVTNPDKVCPARQRLVENYRSDLTGLDEDEVAAVLAEQFAYAEDDDERESSRFPFATDEAKLQFKLGEQGHWAKYYGCEGPKGNVCPPRIGMNNNTTRSLGVTAFRKVKALFNK